ncbi:cation:proton antiporter [Chroococcidiopsis sp. FACHB-1243]|jgi:monovalent cation:proton antiporter-2 (CPA2) family protein|uniref:monovalent cation:proton antiporter-2 (CPA2) family protein n=1 Tax=Chroococcidiopsis sp. [FACHB-1243] TaxID=2692781 RepID=UPI000B6D117C|nr:monovalent cation:proton antiporter-2 (CPA2) family protein [Chroococcidiopsis sp. [FACHB-1243]]MBD2309085.1 cation:proton antiporter [Chroococcidiopsis sp. [FACHB-1243]]OWY65229.1 potassium transporter [cyanobacterium TDX16]
MSNENLFFQAFVYLAAAVITVPISKRLGLGSVLGYLIAGVVIGPFGLRLVGQEGQDVMRFAEFGVVMMLFLVGLQLQPDLLWRMRVPILGLGGLQMVANVVLLSGLGILLGLSWQTALAIALILPLSSTAIGVQTLTERGLMRTEGGQSAFSILLFQAVAVIPILALLPLLTTNPGEAVSQTATSSNTLAGWQQTLLVMSTVGGIVVGGRFLMRPVFRFIAATRLREIFTATALLLVVGITLAMQAVGLSPALGTFVAGVVLAESEYRHELMSTVEPFQSLLLGLFFLSVGASINFNLILGQPLLIFGLIVGVSILKSGVLIALGKLFKLDLNQSILFAFALVQGDEFAFVLFSFAAQSNVLSENLAGSLIAVVALSMLLSPLFMIAYDRLIVPRFLLQLDDREADDIEDNENSVIIAGFGRFGQIVGRLLLANGYPITVLEYNPAQIELLRRFGWKVFYGDASRIDLLYAAGAAQSKLLVVAIDDREQILEIVDLARKHFPHLKILARAIDRRHCYELIRRGVDVIQRETFGSALDMGVEALKLLGLRAYKAHRAAQTFRHHDEEALYDMASVEGDDTALMARSRQLAQDLERILQSDEREIAHDDRAWDVLAQQRDAI